MKKTVSMFLVFACIIGLFSCPVAAANTNKNVDEVLVSITKIDLPDGGYIIEEVSELENDATSRATSSKSGTKTSTRYTASGTAIFAVKVTGTFSYTGSSSWATYSAANVYIYVSDATYVSKNAYYSGSTAYATGTVSYLGSNTTRTVALSCSATGVLS